MTEVSDDLLQLLADVELTLQHARTFIVSREKMHKNGVELYDADLAKLSAAITRLAEDNQP